MKTCVLLATLMITQSYIGVFAQKKKFPIDSIAIIEPCMYTVHVQEDVKIHFSLDLLDNGILFVTQYKRKFQSPATDSLIFPETLNAYVHNALQENIPEGIFHQPLMLHPFERKELFKRGYSFLKDVKGTPPIKTLSIIEEKTLGKPVKFGFFIEGLVLDMSQIKRMRHHLVSLAFVVFDLETQKTIYHTTWEGYDKHINSQKKAEKVVTQFFDRFKMYKKIHH